MTAQSQSSKVDLTPNIMYFAHMPAVDKGLGIQSLFLVPVHCSMQFNWDSRGSHYVAGGVHHMVWVSKYDSKHVQTCRD